MFILPVTCLLSQHGNDGLMRCDMHVHTRFSGMCTVPVLKGFCRESYNDPGAVYDVLKSRGMNLVTVTDHDSIDAAECLRHHTDFFLSEEVTCTMPSGTEVHVGVYNLNEKQHLAIQQRRSDMPRLLAYLTEQGLLFSLNHPFSALTGRRDPSDMMWFKDLFPMVETRNGQMLPGSNQLAWELARLSRRAAIGGSDSHTLSSLGNTYTEVPGARTVDEFVQGLWLHHCVVRGEQGNPWKLMRDLLRLAYETMQEKPAASLLAPLIPLIPIASLMNYVSEIRFARRWRASVQDETDTENRFAAPMAPLPSKGVAT
jgi:predicted metal-dependent phosphoesterase TrpH